MPVTLPDIVISGTIIESAWGNSVRSAFIETNEELDKTAPALVTTEGDLVYATDAGEITRLGIGGDFPSATDHLTPVSGVPAWGQPHRLGLDAFTDATNPEDYPRGIYTFPISNTGWGSAGFIGGGDEGECIAFITDSDSAVLFVVNRSATDRVWLRTATSATSWDQAFQIPFLNVAQIYSAAIILANDIALQGIDAGAIARTLIKMNTSGQIELGSTISSLVIIARLANNSPIFGRQVDSTPRQLILIDSSNLINVGDANVGLRLRGSEAAPQYNGNTMLHTGNSKSVNVTGYVLGNGTLQSNSFGISSVTRTAVGSYTVNFSTNFANVNYAVVAMAVRAPSFGPARQIVYEAAAVGSVTIRTYDAAGTTLTDSDFRIMASGDQ